MGRRGTSPTGADVAEHKSRLKISPFLRRFPIIRPFGVSFLDGVRPSIAGTHWAEARAHRALVVAQAFCLPGKDDEDGLVTVLGQFFFLEIGRRVSKASEKTEVGRAAARFVRKAASFRADARVKNGRATRSHFRPACSIGTRRDMSRLAGGRLHNNFCVKRGGIASDDGLVRWPGP